MTRGRKRGRHPDSDSNYEDEPERGKRLKRTESDVGKDWLCNEPECDKQFKTVSFAVSWNEKRELRPDADLVDDRNEPWRCITRRRI